MDQAAYRIINEPFSGLTPDFSGDLGSKHRKRTRIDHASFTETTGNKIRILKHFVDGESLVAQHTQKRRMDSRDKSGAVDGMRHHQRRHRFEVIERGKQRAIKSRLDFVE